MRVVRARCCARNLRSRNGARCPQQLYQVNQRTNIDVGSRLETHLGANPAIEHPCRNLKTALRHRTADTAAENVHVHPLDSLMNVNLTPGPRMTPIENLTNIGPVGVPLPCCTGLCVRIAALAGWRLLSLPTAPVMDISATKLRYQRPKNGEQVRRNIRRRRYQAGAPNFADLFGFVVSKEVSPA